MPALEQQRAEGDDNCAEFHVPHGTQGTRHGSCTVLSQHERIMHHVPNAAGKCMACPDGAEQHTHTHMPMDAQPAPGLALLLMVSASPAVEVTLVSSCSQSARTSSRVCGMEDRTGNARCNGCHTRRLTSRPDSKARPTPLQPYVADRPARINTQ